MLRAMILAIGTRHAIAFVTAVTSVHRTRCRHAAGQYPHEFPRNRVRHYSDAFFSRQVRDLPIDAGIDIGRAPAIGIVRMAVLSVRIHPEQESLERRTVRAATVVRIFQTTRSHDHLRFRQHCPGRNAFLRPSMTLVVGRTSAGAR